MQPREITMSSSSSQESARFGTCSPKHAILEQSQMSESLSPLPEPQEEIVRRTHDEESGEEEEEQKEIEKPAKLFLGGLSLEATSQTVIDYFKDYGEIVEVRVPMHKVLPGKTRGFGFVTFKEASVAEQVLLKPEHKICGRQVDVKYAVQVNSTSTNNNDINSQQHTASSTKGATQNIQGSASSRHAQAHQNGASNNLPPHAHSRQRRNHPRETYTPQVLANAAATLSSSSFVQSSRRDHNSAMSHQSVETDSPFLGSASRGSSVAPGMDGTSSSTASSVSYVTASTPTTFSCGSSVATESDFNGKIFVGGLAAAVTSDVLKDYFAGQFGSVQSATVMIDRETNRSRGFGFVVFRDEEALRKTLSKTDHTILGKRVEVKLAIPKELIEQQHPHSEDLSSSTGRNLHHHHLHHQSYDFHSHQHHRSMQMPHDPQDHSQHHDIYSPAGNNTTPVYPAQLNTLYYMLPAMHHPTGVPMVPSQHGTMPFPGHGHYIPVHYYHTSHGGAGTYVENAPYVVATFSTPTTVPIQPAPRGDAVAAANDGPSSVSTSAQHQSQENQSAPEN